MLTSGTYEFANSLTSKTVHVGVNTMKRLVQGHLHHNLDLKTDMSRLGIEPRPPCHSRCEQLVNNYFKHLTELFLALDDGDSEVPTCRRRQLAMSAMFLSVWRPRWMRWSKKMADLWPWEMQRSTSGTLSTDTPSFSKSDAFRTR
jgi:hypothetical protein